MKWTFANIWNESLEQNGGKPVTPRDHIWASELGGPFIDRWLKMNGEPYTNPPNARSQRKFEAGNIWEWLVGLILKRAGILIIPEQMTITGEPANKPRNWVYYQYPDLLKVTGKTDFIAGGKPDWEKAKIDVLSLELPDVFTRATEKIISHFQEKYTDGLDEVVLEIKSVSSFMYDVYERTGVANPNHRLQAFHYIKAKGMPEAHIVYICRDDARMMEVGIYNPSPIEDEYRRDIETMTGYYRGGEQPPLERFIVFDDDFGRFSANYKIGYSNYLTKLYNLKNQMEFDDTYKPITDRWNRVLGRIVNGDKMTDMNLAVIQDIKKDYPDFDRLVEIAKSKKLVTEEENGQD